MKVINIDKRLTLELNDEWHIIMLTIVIITVIFFSSMAISPFIYLIYVYHNDLDIVSFMVGLILAIFGGSLSFLSLKSAIRAFLPQTLTIEILESHTILIKKIASIISIKKRYDLMTCLTLKPAINQGFGYYILAGFNDGKRYVLVPPHVESDSAKRAKRRGVGMCNKIIEGLNVDLEIKVVGWERYTKDN